MDFGLDKKSWIDGNFKSYGRTVLIFFAACLQDELSDCPGLAEYLNSNKGDKATALLRKLWSTASFADLGHTRQTCPNISTPHIRRMSHLFEIMAYVAWTYSK